jgi:hypothetical protein
VAQKREGNRAPSAMLRSARPPLPRKK